MKYNILFEGPYLTQSGYGEHARLFLGALKENENLEIFGIPLPWGQTSWLSDDTPERQWLDDISLKISQQTPESFYRQNIRRGFLKIQDTSTPSLKKRK